MKKFLSVKEFARESKVSTNLIYYYIQNGLLPKPQHLPRARSKKPSGGYLAVLDKKYLKRIVLIQKMTKEGKKVTEIKNILKSEFTEESRRNFILDRLEALKSMAISGKYQTKEFKNEMDEIETLLGCETLNPSAIKPLLKKLHNSKK